MHSNDTRAATPAAPDRRTAVERLYFQNFAFIKAMVHADPRMTFDETEEIVHRVAENLEEYGGPLTDVAFREWIRQLLLPALGLYGVKHACEKPVRDAIKKVFAGYEWRGDVESARADAEQNVWLWALLHLGELLDPGANPTSWLKEIAKFKAMTLRQQMVRGNQRFEQETDMERLGRDNEDAYLIEPFLGGKKDEFDANHQQPYARLEDVR